MFKRLYLGLFSLFVFTGCAKITVLEGGPRDESLPKIVQQKPQNELCNVSTNDKFIVTLNFDKNVYLKNPEKIIITPKLTSQKEDNKTFDCFDSDNIITLIIYSGLEKNTTYSVNFNNTIMSVRTEQPVENKIITFSTGERIDQNTLSGYAFDSMSLSHLKNGIVCLYNFDSYKEIQKADGTKEKVHANIISTKDPDYFTKTNEQGTFIFNNVAEGKYICCAGEGKKWNTSCDPQEDCYGFTFVDIKKKEQKIGINIGKADISEFKIDATTPKCNFFDIRFSKPIIDYDIKVKIQSNFYQKLHIYSQLLEDKKTVRIFNYGFRLLERDSLKSEIIAYDSIGNKLVQPIFISFSQGQKVSDDLKIFISNNNLKKTLIDGVKIKVTTSLPLLSFDVNKIFLLINEKYPLELSEADIKIGKHKNELFITKKFNLKEFLEQSDPMNKLHPISTDLVQIDVIIKDDALESVTKKMNKEVKKKFIYSTKIGSLSGNVFTKNKFTVQLLDTNLDIIEESKNRSFEFKNLAPGKYVLRTLYYKGKNWSCGNIFKLEQADRIVFYKELIEILPNWKKENIYLTDL